MLLNIRAYMGVVSQTHRNLAQTLHTVRSVLTLPDDADQNCPTVWLGVNTRAHWSFENPVKFEGSEEEKPAKCRKIRDLIEKKIKDLLGGQNIPLQA